MWVLTFVTSITRFADVHVLSHPERSVCPLHAQVLIIMGENRNQRGGCSSSVRIAVNIAGNTKPSLDQEKTIVRFDNTFDSFNGAVLSDLFQRAGHAIHIDECDVEHISPFYCTVLRTF